MGLAGKGARQGSVGGRTEERKVGGWKREQTDWGGGLTETVFASGGSKGTCGKEPQLSLGSLAWCPGPAGASGSVLTSHKIGLLIAPACSGLTARMN